MCVLEDNGLLQSVNVPLAQVYDCCPVVQIPPAERPFVSMIFSRLTEERRHIYPMKEEQTATLITQLLILFLRHMEHSVGEGSCNAAQDALRLMNLRSREPDLTCGKIAATVHYSESQLARVLKDAFGMTFGELLREIRIRNACGLLKTTEYPVESIALWSGYTSRDGFYQAFTADQGMTPAEYRDRFFFLRSRPGGKKPVWRTALRKNRLLSSPGLSDSGYIDRCCGIFRLQRKLPETCPEGAGHFLFRAAGENPGLSCETAASRNFADSGIHRQRKRLCFTGNFLPGI